VLVVNTFSPPEFVVVFVVAESEDYFVIPEDHPNPVVTTTSDQTVIVFKFQVRVAGRYVVSLEPGALNIPYEEAPPVPYLRGEPECESYLHSF
jgi:hypothetical protein